MIFTKEWILKRAESGLSVNKYSWGHEKLRKKARRLCKDGFLKLEWQNKSEFFYKIA